jgi:hypothetical protein
VEAILSNDDTDETKKRLRALAGKNEGQLDQRFTGIRSEYDELTAGERVKVRKWLEAVDAVAASTPDLTTIIQTKIEFLIQKGPDEVQALRVSPSSLLRAIEAWDKGETFTPKAMKDF